MADANRLAAVSIQIETYRRTLWQRMQHRREEREMRRRQALLAIQEKAPAILAAYSSVRRAYLFGSVVHPGAFHLTSDIDIAV